MGQDAKKLGDFLRAARGELELSLRSVESVTGISNAYLSQLETGKIKTPAPNVLHKLAGQYSVPYALLMDLAGYPVAEPGDESEELPDQLAARIGAVTDDEADQLVEYLAFIRSRERRGR